MLKYKLILSDPALDRDEAGIIVDGIVQNGVDLSKIVANAAAMIGLTVSLANAATLKDPENDGEP